MLSLDFLILSFVFVILSLEFVISSLDFVILSFGFLILTLDFVIFSFEILILNFYSNVINMMNSRYKRGIRIVIKNIQRKEKLNASCWAILWSRDNRSVATTLQNLGFISSRFSKYLAEAPDHMWPDVTRRDINI